MNEERKNAEAMLLKAGEKDFFYHALLSPRLYVYICVRVQLERKAYTDNNNNLTTQ